MLMGEYDYATDIAVQREEAAKEAWQEGSLQNALQNARNLKNLGVPLDIISKGTGLSNEEIKDL